jgi:hypothetical protein
VVVLALRLHLPALLATRAPDARPLP